LVKNGGIERERENLQGHVKSDGVGSPVSSVSKMKSDENKTDKKVVIIGLDGLPYQTFLSLSTDPKFSTFNRIFKLGFKSKMLTVVPPYSPPAWASIITGMNPAKHGIYDLMRRTEEDRLKLLGSSLLRGKTIWDIASVYGRKVIVMNVPITYPAYPVNGILISGFPVLNPEKSVYPQNLLNQIKTNVGKYIVDIDVGPMYSIRNVDDFIEKLGHITLQRAKTLVYLMENYEWDLVFGVFTEIDRLHHVFWGCLKKESLFSKYEITKYKQLLTSYYTTLNDALDQIVRIVNEHNALLIIISDHGFEYVEKYVGINNILKKCNYIESSVLPKLREKIFELLNKFHLTKLVFKLLPKQYTNIAQLSKSFTLDIKKSIAYYSHYNGITINPHSLHMKQKVIEDLYNTIDAETGSKIFESIFSKEELYSGPYINELPDLIFCLREGYKAIRELPHSSVSKIRDVFKSSKMTGAHQGRSSVSYAVFCAYGKFINSNADLPAVTIYDIAPTVLHAMNLPIINTVDGRILREIFDKNNITYKRPGTFISGEEVRGLPKTTDLFTERDEEVVRERLRKLGYL
jgi:predicted AlkP superfamily phosphohydrolase/phosphomutase